MTDTERQAATAEATTSDPELEASDDDDIALCGGDQRAAPRALVTANHYLNAEVERLRL